MISSETELFLEISALLTGFNKTELQGTGMVATYYNRVDVGCSRSASAGRFEFET